MGSVRGTAPVGDPGARILIVDDHALFTDAIRWSLERAGLTVVAVASNAEEGLAAARRSLPDVVLLDVGLPGASGLVLGKQILAEMPSVRVVTVTGISDPRFLREATALGFHGFLTKDMAVSDFAAAVTAVVNGRTVFPHRLGGVPPAPRSEEDRHADLLTRQLTPREREVLALLVRGMSGSAIARQLEVSPNTVRTHIQSILAKLQVHSRLEAVAFAVRHGVVAGPAGSADGRSPWTA